MAYDPNNIFARILRGEIPCQEVHASEHILAFRDITPQAPVHVLCIPRIACTDFSDFVRQVGPQGVSDFWGGVEETIQKLDLASGYRLVTNTGAHGSQEVPHFHVHILGGEVLGPLRGA